MKFWLTFVGGFVLGTMMGGFCTSFFLYDDVTRDKQVSVGKNPAMRRLPKEVSRAPEKPRVIEQKSVSVRSFPTVPGREHRRLEAFATPSVDEDLPPSALPAEEVNPEDLPPAGVPAEVVSPARWDEASIGN